MKLVVAVVRPEKANEVLEALFRADVQGLTISRAQGHGGETEQVETYRGTTVKMELQEKVRFEIGVSDHFVDPTVKAILGAARTGDVGDGKVFVLPVEKIYRIRTGEEGTWAEREGKRLAIVRTVVRRIVKGTPDDPDAFDHFVHGLLEPLTDEKPAARQLKLDWK